MFYAISGHKLILPIGGAHAGRLTSDNASGVGLFVCWRLQGGVA